MMYKPLNREQVLANCAFLFTNGVELVTYHQSIPDLHRPRILHRQYHALVLQKGLAAGGSINEHVLLRTSEAGLTSDAAIAILADEVERQIGEIVNHGGRVRPVSKRKIAHLALEDSPDPLSLDNLTIHEIGLATQAEDVIALEKAHFDAAVIADIEAHEAHEAHKALQALEEQYHIDVQNAIDLAVDIAHERTRFDDEIIADFELYEAGLNLPDQMQYLQEYRCEYWREPVGEIECEAEVALALSEAEIQGANAEEVEQGIIAGFEEWEAELSRIYEEHTRRPFTSPDTTPLDTTQSDSTPPDTTPPNTTQPDSTPPDTTPPDTSPLDTALPDTTPPDTTQPNSTPPDTTPPDTTPPDTESAMPGSLTQGEEAYLDSLLPPYTLGATNSYISWHTHYAAETPQTGSEATSAPGSPIVLYAPRRSRHVNAWLEGQYTRREQAWRKRAAVSRMEVDDTDTMSTSSEAPELLRGCNLAAGKTGRKRRKTQRDCVREGGMASTILDGEEMMVDKPEPQDLPEGNRTKDENDQEIEMRLTEHGKGHGHKLDQQWKLQSIPTNPPSPAPKRVYPHISDLSAHTHGLQPTHRASIKAWVDAAKVYWTHSQRHLEDGALDSAYVDFLLACTIVARTIPCFPNFAMVRAAGRASTEFVGFVELSKELKRNMARFMNVREEIKRNNKASGVRSAAYLGLGRGRGRGKGGTALGLTGGVLPLTTI